jgi:hypothetical protein
MRQNGSRRFTLLDLMALVVAFAAGLAIPRSFGDFVTVRRQVDVSFRAGENSTTNIGVSSSDSMNLETANLFKPPIKGQVIYWARQLSFWPGPCLGALSLVTLILVFRHAHQTTDRLARGPGTATCIAVLLAMATAAVRLPQLLIPNSFPGQAIRFRWAEWWLEFWFTVPKLAGFAVAVCWVTLALGGQMRAGGVG